MRQREQLQRLAALDTEEMERQQEERASKLSGVEAAFLQMLGLTPEKVAVNKRSAYIKETAEC